MPFCLYICAMRLLILLYLFLCLPVSARADSVVIETRDGQHHSFQMEVARTPEAIERGLMFRTSLPPNSGMIFIFDRAQSVRFWMRNTLIPLDMLFIKADGTIAKVHARAKPQDLTPIPSETDVIAVIEINGGRAESLGIGAGSRILSSDIPEFLVR